MFVIQSSLQVLDCCFFDFALTDHHSNTVVASWIGVLHGFRSCKHFWHFSLFSPRYRKFLRMVDTNSTATASIVPELPASAYERAELLPTCRVAPDRVFLCRKVYESRRRAAAAASLFF